MNSTMRKFKYQLILCAALVCFSRLAVSQIPTFDYVRQIGSTGDDLVVDIALDASGNIYATGRFNGTVDFDPGVGIFNLTSAGGADLFVSKSDPSGNLIWAVRAGGVNTEAGGNIEVDGIGNVYVNGSFANAFDFDPGAGVFTQTPAGNDDIFLLKLDASGNFIWARRFGGTDTDLGSSLALDNAGDIYMAGGFRGTADFNPDPAVTFNLIATALYDIYVTKISSAGALVWAKQASGFGFENASGVVIDPSGNVLVTGNFQVTVDFDPGPGVYNMAPGGGSSNIFVLKLDPSGNFIWANQMGGPADDGGSDIATDADGNVYTTGGFYGTADFDPGAGTFNLVSAGDRDVFVSKLNAAGQHVWAKGFGGTLGDYGTAISTDPSTNVYLSGYFFGTSDVDPGTGSFTITSAGGTDGFVSKLDPSGNFLFAYRFGGTIDDNTLSSSLNSTGDILTGISFRDLVDFDPGAGSANLTSAGGGDIAILKIIQSPLTGPTISGFTPSSGMVGATVTITGTNFNSVPANNIVTFNGVTAVVSSSSISSMTVTVPAAASTGPISVTVGGLTATSVSNFTVIPPPVITITDQPVSEQICPGGTSTLTVAATGATNLTYRWQRFNTTTSIFENLNNGSGYAGVTSATLTIDLASGAAPGDYRVRVNGDLATEVISDVAAVTERIPPAAPSVTAIPSDNGLCGPSVVTFTATATAPGEFRWYSAQNKDFPLLTENTGMFTTPLMTAPSNYFVSYFDGMCESDQAPAVAIVNYDGPGAMDPSFAPPANGEGSISFIDKTVSQPDGKLLLNFFEVANEEYQLYRLNADGSADAGFTPLNRDLFTGRVDVLGIQSSGKILIAGRFTQIDGTTYGRIARVNADGTLDPTFNASGSGFNAQVSSLEVQPDDKIIAGGSFTTYNGAPANRLIRLNEDGSVDASFNIGAGPNSNLRIVHLQPDNKILVSGLFTSFNGAAVERMARLNTDGSLDNTFSPATGLNPLVILVQNDNKILVGGNFSAVAGVSRNNIVRLNANGTLDTTFDPGSGFNDWVYSLYQEPSGKIMVGGWFENFNGVSRNFIARLNPDGSLDHFFDAGIGPYTLVTTILPYGVNRILASGYIDHWNGNLHNGIALVNNECIRTPTGYGASTCDGSLTLTACGGLDGQYRWYSQSSGGSEIVGETKSTLTISNLNQTTTYYVSLKDAVCESPRIPVIASIDTRPSAPVADPVSVCANTQATLKATGGSNGNYRWYSAAQVLIANEFNDTYITDALTSNTSFFASIVSGSCESVHTEIPVQVNTCIANTPPVMSTTTLKTQIGGTVTLDLMALMSDPDNNIDLASLRISVQPSSGALADISPEGILMLDYSGLNFSGVDYLTIRVCDDTNSCTETVISVEVAADVIVYNAVSANGDGLNDILRLEYIEILEDTRSNEVTIYNRWGDRVFEIADYDNERRAFTGLNENGNELPPGTYFYTIRYSSGRELRTGYLYLTR
jgi:uncharacterized delta-60 repeat protein/gliding motility-associated-like protein